MTDSACSHLLHALKGIRNIRSQDYSFPGTFVLKTIRSLEHSFLDRLFHGTFVPGTWTFPDADRSGICQPSSTWSGSFPDDSRKSISHNCANHPRRLCESSAAKTGFQMIRAKRLRESSGTVCARLR